MRKLSQRELLEELSFKNLLRGTLKGVSRGAIGLAKGAAKAFSPEGAALIGKAADAVGSSIANVAASSPKIGLRAFLNRPENRRLFKNYSIGEEERLPNGDRSIQITGKFINPSDPTAPPTPITTSVVFQRVDNGGIDPEKWAPVGAFDAATGQFVTKQRKYKGRKNKKNMTSTSSTSSTPSTGNTTSTSTGFSQSPSTITSGGRTTTI